MRYLNNKSLNHIKKVNATRSIVALASDYLLIATSITVSLMTSSTIAYIASVIIIGSRLRAYENLIHDASHFNLFKNKALNDFIALLLCGLPTGTSIFAYRISHLKHHRYLGDSTNDPDYIRYKAINIHNLPNGKKHFVFNLLKIITLFNVPKYLLGTVKGFIYNKDAPLSETLIRVLSYSLIATAAIYYQAIDMLVMYWFIPFLTTFQLIRYLAESSEHGGLYQSTEKAMMTRNNLCHPILRFFLYPHNDCYHLVHHLVPAIPFHNLGQAHEILLKTEAHYQSLNHCYGYLFPRKQGFDTTINGMMHFNGKLRKNDLVSSAS